MIFFDRCCINFRLFVILTFNVVLTCSAVLTSTLCRGDIDFTKSKFLCHNWQIVINKIDGFVFLTEAVVEEAIEKVIWRLNKKKRIFGKLMAVEVVKHSLIMAMLLRITVHVENFPYRSSQYKDCFLQSSHFTSIHNRTQAAFSRSSLPQHSPNVPSPGIPNCLLPVTHKCVTHRELTLQYGHIIYVLPRQLSIFVILQRFACLIIMLH